MSTINTVLNRLTIQKARVITAQEAATANVPLTKYQTLKNSRTIESIPLKIYIPKYYESTGAHPNTKRPRMISQYNIDIGCPFYITQPFIANILFNSGYLVVKYRVGTTVYRYIIAGHTHKEAINYNFYVPVYNRELLPRYVSFEFWATISRFIEMQCGMLDNVELLLSLREVPTDGDTTKRLLPAGGPYNRNMTGFSLPRSFPFSQPLTVYNDNA